MIFVLLSSLYAVDVEEKQSFYGRLTSAVSSACSYLPSMKTTIKASAAAGCTALYFMQNSSSNHDQSPSLVPSFNGTNAQLVPFQNPSTGGSFDQMACLAITGLVGSFTGTLSSLLMGTSCMITGTMARHLVDHHSERIEFGISGHNCTYYYEYLSDNPTAKKILIDVPCPLNSSFGSCGSDQFMGSPALDLSNKKINDTDIKILVPALLQLNIECLNISNNGIGFQGMRYLAHFFEQCGQYLPGVLDISSNNIGGYGVTKILLAIWHNPEFIQAGGVGLYMNNNNIQSSEVGILSSAMILFPEGYIATLSMNANNITDSGAMKFVKVFKKWQRAGPVYLKNNSIDIATCIVLQEASQGVLVHC